MRFLGHVFPRSPSKYSFKCSLRNGVSSCKRSARAIAERIALSQFGNYVLCKSGSRMYGATEEWRSDSASLIPHVRQVGGLSAHDQMARVRAGRIVASMKYFDVIGNRAVVKLVGKTVCQDEGSFRVFGKKKYTVAKWRGAAAPLPASIGAGAFNNFGPISFFGRACMAIVPANKADRPSFDLIKPLVGFVGNICALAAATFTIAVRNLHIKPPFVRLLGV